jgi:8-oxo-dGTP pyrophosphatase MutT (NUDIX family)
LTSREELTGFLKNHQSDFNEECEFISQFLELLQSERCYHRDHLPGHITGSAWIVNETKSHVLLVQHAKLNKWLQPGGHADGDENILNVAIREVEEETGLTSITLNSSRIFDLDIHPIPARKDFPDHLHYDVRFAFTASSESNLLISDESRDLQWINLQQVPVLTNQNTSILRMVEKTLRSNQH